MRALGLLLLLFGLFGTRKSKPAPEEKGEQYGEFRIIVFEGEDGFGYFLWKGTISIASAVGLPSYADAIDDAKMAADDYSPAPDLEEDYAPQPGDAPLWMLPGNDEGVRPWSFGQKRPYQSANPTDHHKGIDIDAEALDPVLMPENGEVVKLVGWSGKLTRGVHVQLVSGRMLVIGALHPDHLPELEQTVARGELLGRIGTYPGGDTMLHVEEWTAGAKRVPWLLGKPQPPGLVDPTEYLQSMER